MKWLFPLLLSGTALAEPQLDKLTMDIKRMPFQRDFFFPGQESWGYELRLNLDLRWGRFFWDNEIPARTYDSAFKYIGWKYDAGVRLIPGVDVVWSHFSQHALDEHRDRFPVTDSYGVRITWFERNKQ
jgi:hypothetical protein